MKILIVTQHYWPENYKSTDIAETLVKLGNEVTVLCGLPNYPEGYIYKEYRHCKNREQVHNGVNIVRAFEFPRRNNIFSRILNYYSFPYFSKRIVNKKLPRDFDVVFTIEASPIMMCEAALEYKKKYNKKVIMYEMDLWPLSLLASRVKKDGIIYNYYKKISSQIYSSCDKIIVSTFEHINYIKNIAKYTNVEIKCLPQYAEKVYENINPLISYSNKKITIVFAGNIGKAQDLFRFIYYFSLIDANKYDFYIVGDGSKLSQLKAYTKKLKLYNIYFEGKKSTNDTITYYQKADILLLSLEDNDYANLTLPAKLQSYLAAGKMILGLCNGASYNFIKEYKVGLCFKNQEKELFVSTLNSIDKKICSGFAEHNKKIYYKLFSKEKFFEKLQLFLEFYD